MGGRMSDLVSTHSRLKAAGRYVPKLLSIKAVSTHSRLKAAGRSSRQDDDLPPRFNTQPPEGGWL